VLKDVSITDTLLGLLKEVFHEFTTNKTVITTLFVAFAKVCVNNIYIKLDYVYCFRFLR